MKSLSSIYYKKGEALEEGQAAEDMVVDGVHNYSTEEAYVWPTDPKVLKKLEWFRDQKLGLMMHWGPYSQLGVVESWALSDGDADWSRDGIDWEVTGEEFKEEYFGLNRTFNPLRFEPEKWADLAKEAGMRYVLFTTKHHDGFCMWDTHYSDYKIILPQAGNRHLRLFLQGGLACGQLLEGRYPQGEIQIQGPLLRP